MQEELIILEMSFIATNTTTINKESYQNNNDCNNKERKEK